MTTPTMPITRSEKKEHEATARRKQVQAGLSTAGGLIGAGAFGALAGSKTLPKVGRLVRTKHPEKYQRAATKLGRGALEAGTVGGGVGALSALNFANVSRKEAQQEKKIAATAPVVPAQRKAEMNNQFALKKSLSDIAKAGSRAVPPDAPAWHAARPENKSDEWRRYVSPASLKAYDESKLAESRQQARTHRGIGNAAFGTSLVGGSAAIGAAPWMRHKKAGRLARKVAPIGLATAAVGAYSNKRENELSNLKDWRSRAVRARGYQRMEDEAVGKALRIKSPGGYTKGTLARTGSGKMVLRNSYLTPGRRGRV